MDLNRTVTVVTKLGSVLVITERDGAFTLVCESLAPPELQESVGKPLVIQRPEPWPPRIAQQFAVFGEPGTQVHKGFATSFVRSVETQTERSVEAAD